LKGGRPNRSSRKLRDLDESDIRAIQELSEGDPARALIENILRVVPVSHWSFARFKGYGGDTNALLSSGESDETRAEEFGKIKAEFVLQRHVTAHGPRMAPTIAPLGDLYSSGLAMLLADHRQDLGILTLARTDALGPFTSVEIRALALALDASPELLAPLPFADAESALMYKGESLGLDRTDAAAPEMLVLDTDLNIFFTWSDGKNRRAAMAPAVTGNRLPPILEDVVRDLTSTWTSDAATQHGGVAAPLPFLLVRTQPLQGPTGLFIGVLLDRVRKQRPDLRAAERYAFSPREIQTLALLLDGKALSDICDLMHITSSTVQDHIKSLVSKTGAPNRSAMIAKVLGWRPSV
jgi:DNA-binding CsgD family transcriptional regulator